MCARYIKQQELIVSRAPLHPIFFVNGNGVDNHM